MTNLFVPFALVLAAAISPQAVPTSPAKTATFHSDAMHLDYAYPTVFESMGSAADDAVKEEKDKATGVTKAAYDCVTVPFTGTDTSAGFRMVLIMRMNYSCLGGAPTAADIPGAVMGALKGSLARFGEPTMAQAVSYQVATHDAAVVSGVVASAKYKATFYGTASCVLQGSDVVCWEFLTTDCAKLPEMMALPVTFEGHAAEAVIPAKFSQTCKP